jgi:hypothetical protein
MGESETFTNFVNWAVDKYPAERHCIVTYGHGKGWLGHNILPDLSDGPSMNLTQFQNGLKDVYSHIGKKIDILIMISCFMGMLEVCYQIKDYVSYYIASEGKMATSFISLNNTANILNLYSSSESEIISQNIVDKSHNKQDQHLLFGIKLREINLAISAVNDLSNIGQEFINNSNKNKIGEAFSQSVVNNREDKPHPHDLIAIAQSYDCLNCKEIQEKINHTIIKPNNGRTYTNWNGLSVYFPPNEDEEDMEEYKKLDFSRDTKWDEFLDKHFKSNDKSVKEKYKFGLIRVLYGYGFPSLNRVIEKLFFI